MHIWVILLISTLTAAGDLGFRYQDDQCLNPLKQNGLNPSYMGQCGDFRGSTLISITMEGMDLSGSNYESANLQNINLAGSTMVGANFDQAILAGINLIDAKLHKSSFVGATASNWGVGGARLSDIDFSKANFNNIDLSFIACERCQFASTILKNANLESADLEGANFSGATLKRVDLQKANLRGANFSNAILRGVNFLGTNVEKTQFKNAKFDSQTSLPFSRSRANELGMIFVDYLMAIAEFNGHTFYKVQAKGAMTNANILETCKVHDLHTPCADKTNGKYSDDKCLDVGFRVPDRPMDPISAQICDTNDPTQCPVLDRVFAYMGQGFPGGCGVANDSWCVQGNYFEDGFALCVERY